MATYEKCGKDVHDIVETIKKAYHLKRLGFDKPGDVTVGCLFFRAKRNDAGDIVGPPLRLHGYNAAAIIKVNALKLRAQGLPDAEITIDGDEWETLSAEQRNALIDHELEHLEGKRNKAGAITRDDLDRPMLKLKLHDWQLGGFKVIAERHGIHALEVVNAQAFAVEFGQLLFAFALPGGDKSKRQRAQEFLEGGEQHG
jgi:hypothetical protein